MSGRIGELAEQVIAIVDELKKKPEYANLNFNLEGVNGDYSIGIHTHFPVNTGKTASLFYYPKSDTVQVLGGKTGIYNTKNIDEAMNRLREQFY